MDRLPAAVTTEASAPTREAPWHAGLRAARANLVPGLLVQAAMLGLALAYRYYPPTTGFLNELAAWKERWGYGYSALTAIVAGAFLPELLRIAVFQHGRPRAGNLTNLVFTIPFWAFMGVVVDAFYRVQSHWFGSEPEPLIVLRKVLVDQFIYNPLFAAPFTSLMYDWKNRGFPRRFRALLITRYYRDAVVPTLFATWGVWIPLVSIIYSLPPLLQIPLFGLALSLWVMLYTWMSEKRAAEA